MVDFGRFWPSLTLKITLMVANDNLLTFATDSSPFYLTSDQFSSKYFKWLPRNCPKTIQKGTKNWPFSAPFKTVSNVNIWRHAVFAGSSILISSTFWSILTKIVRAVFEKKSKNRHFDHIFVLFGWSKFFLDNPALSLFSVYRCLTLCKVLRKSLEPFLRKTIN